MKKLLAIFALALFLGGVTAPAIAAINSDLTVITLTEDDPAKKETAKKTAETKTEKSGDCSSETKTKATKTAEKKSSDCDAPAKKTQTAKK
jgi:hypothetical protein